MLQRPVQSHASRSLGRCVEVTDQPLLKEDFCSVSLNSPLWRGGQRSWTGWSPGTNFFPPPDKPAVNCRVVSAGKNHLTSEPTKLETDLFSRRFTEKQPMLG